jgi:putative transposase
MRAQVRGFSDYAKANALPAETVLRDRASTFRDADFDAELRSVGIQVKRLTFRAPNLNAYVERFVQSIQQECLDKFIVFGREHLDHLNREYLAYYHQERPHQAKGNEPLMKPAGAAVSTGNVVCSERLGGVLRHYYRREAA